MTSRNTKSVFLHCFFNLREIRALIALDAFTTHFSRATRAAKCNCTNGRFLRICEQARLKKALVQYLILGNFRKNENIFPLTRYRAVPILQIAPVNLLLNRRSFVKKPWSPGPAWPCHLPPSGFLPREHFFAQDGPQKPVAVGK